MKRVLLLALVLGFVVVAWIVATGPLGRRQALPPEAVGILSAATSWEVERVAGAGGSGEVAPEPGMEGEATATVVRVEGEAKRALFEALLAGVESRAHEDKTLVAATADPAFIVRAKHGADSVELVFHLGLLGRIEYSVVLNDLVNTDETPAAPLAALFGPADAGR